MAEIVDLIDKVKRYYKFTRSEVKGLVISILITAFIFSFNEWGPGAEFNLLYGLVNFFNAILIVTISFLVHFSGQRVWSLATGYKHEFQMWSIGLGISLVLAFLTRGAVWWFIVPGGFIVHHLAGHRLGWFRYGINYWAIGLIAFAGPLANIIFAIIFKLISGFVSSPFIDKVTIFNIIFAVISLLPIPPLDGSKIFFAARMLYVFTVSLTVAAAFLLISNIPIWIAVLGSFGIAVILWLLYYVFFESYLWPY